MTKQAKRIKAWTGDRLAIHPVSAALIRNRYASGSVPTGVNCRRNSLFPPFQTDTPSAS